MGGGTGVATPEGSLLKLDAWRGEVLQYKGVSPGVSPQKSIPSTHPKREN